MLQPYYKLRDEFSANRAATSFTPLQLASLYNFPAGDGTGQKIGIIQLGGGYVYSDISTYFVRLGIVGAPNITAVGIDGATNNPSDTSGANLEVILDTEIIAAIVPKAAIVVYFAPNSFNGFYNAINRAMTDGCTVISISWGAPESAWGAQNLARFNTLFQTAATSKITITAASGDNGSSDGAPGNNVDFPASSPWVIACGGTTLTASGNSISSEVTWNNHTGATGGGISKTFAKPSYQNSVTYALNNRGVPDIAGNADPNTGYSLYYRGNVIVIGGTSAVSPLWAALTARINQQLVAAGKPTAGAYHSLIYSNPTVCRDIITGGNGAFSAVSSWDPCTGFGSPKGQVLATLLTNPPTPTPSPAPTPQPTPVSNVPVAAFTANVVSGTNSVSVTFTNSSTKSPTSYSWNFGDGTTSSVTSPLHVFTNYVAGTTKFFTVSLTATNSSGFNTVTKVNYIGVTSPSVIANNKPVVSFVANATKAKRGSKISFTNNTASATATAWMWTFGDGKTSSAKTPSNTYVNPGIYTVTLKATNASGSTLLTKSNYIVIS